ncbi:hypothetical protein L3X38_016126 [Prunus dulcis]|uniref:Uncharacterized protein n=1 Tax=Prunus dulcis TaxID=3755 RepID=A0AAD4W7E5_PRUDU|nr:hypothetical protein L3X38_016126 [Prunus dulcis]
MIILIVFLGNGYAGRTFSWICGGELELGSEPLLDKKSSGKSQKTELEHASFLSKLTFAWINPLLKLGSSKTLALEDIPSLVSEDEAALAYQNFAYAWDSLSRERSSSSTRNLVLQTIAKVYMKENIWIAFCAFLRNISVGVSPLLLYAFEVWNEDEVSLGGSNLSKAAEAFWFGKEKALSWGDCELYSSRCLLHGRVPMVVTYNMEQCIASIPCIGVLFWVVGLGALPGLIPLFICGLLNVPFAKALQKCQSQVMIAQDE